MKLRLINCLLSQYHDDPRVLYKLSSLEVKEPKNGSILLTSARAHSSGHGARLHLELQIGSAVRAHCGEGKEAEVMLFKAGQVIKAIETA